ncbi:hypothetical protein KSW81_006147 [Nannochloris sp. 'desiccata']|nr:hypothetical protein KSW81_006147 [Chlorella desiccata (nom. nud.)]
MNNKGDLWHSPTVESANPAENVLSEASVTYSDPSETDEARRLMLASQVEAAMKAVAIRREAAMKAEAIQREAVKGPVDLRFYNRSFEMKFLQEKLDNRPIEVLLIVGPKNCGKSRLKAELISRDATNQPVIYVDCGLEGAPTPKDMAQQLLKLIMERRKTFFWYWFITVVEKLSGFPLLPEQVKYGMEMSSVIGKVVKKGFFNEAKAELGDLAHIQKSFLALLDMLPTCGTISQKKYPTIIIDEVNRLREWEEKYPTDLTNFVDFLQRIAKQEKKAHVILLTSESFMVSWLQRGNGETVFEVIVLGDLPEEEAERFVRGGKMEDGNGEEEFWPGWISKYPKLEMNDDDWKEVFEACGGSMFTLSRCVNSAGRIKSILIQPAKKVRDIIRNGPKALVPPIGAGPALWTADHYKAVVPLIVESEHHAVPKKKAAAALEGPPKVPMPEGVDADQILHSMVEWNVLNMRPYFELAKDVPRQAFGPEDVEEEDLDDVMTMPSAAHFSAANKWMKQKP